jgi:type 1 fimbria pilin
MQVNHKLVSTLVIIVILLGCSKTSTQNLDERVSADGTVKFSGTFRGYGSEKVSGQAKIYLIENQYKLKLENFSTTNVYLSREVSPSEFISLGNLKSTNGNQVYEITGTPDFSQHRFVLIHCQRYNHLYGSAELMQ